MTTLINIAITICTAAPILFVFTLITLFIVHNTKTMQDVPLYGKIISWVFYIIFVAAFLLGWFAPNKKLQIIAFICGVADFALFLLIFGVSQAIKKSRYKNCVKFTTTGTIVSATMTRSIDKQTTGTEPFIKTYYNLKIKYLDKDGQTKFATSIKDYTLSEIAYLNSFPYLNLTVGIGYCEIDADTSIAPPTYNQKDLDGIDIHNLNEVGSTNKKGINFNIYIIGKCACLVFVAPIILLMILIAINNITTNLPISLGCLAVAIVCSFTIIKIWRYCTVSNNILKKGEECYAISFKPAGITTSNSTYYNVNYEYEINGKTKVKTERVLPQIYEKVKHIDKLPIKIYKNKATIDIDRIK